MLGTTDLTAQLRGYTSEDDLYNDPEPNPFYFYALEDLTFSSVLLENNEVFVTIEETEVILTPATPATHLPVPLYEYMKSNFFDWVCAPSDPVGNPANSTSIVTPLMTCQCNGNNYQGMPELQMILSSASKDRLSGPRDMYAMQPYNYEMFPKVQQSTKVTMCDLGLWANTDNVGVS